jgi:hypothetical protein
MTYADHPTALQLRAMNIIDETTKERGATILMPTSMVDSMNPAVALVLAGQKTAPQKIEQASAAVAQRAERERRGTSSGRHITIIAARLVHLRHASFSINQRGMHHET